METLLRGEKIYKKWHIMFHNDDFIERRNQNNLLICFSQGNCCTEGNRKKGLYFPLKHISYGKK